MLEIYLFILNKVLLKNYFRVPEMLKTLLWESIIKDILVVFVLSCRLYFYSDSKRNNKLKCLFNTFQKLVLGEESLGLISILDLNKEDKREEESAGSKEEMILEQKMILKDLVKKLQLVIKILEEEIIIEKEVIHIEEIEVIVEIEEKVIEIEDKEVIEVDMMGIERIEEIEEIEEIEGIEGIEEKDIEEEIDKEVDNEENGEEETIIEVEIEDKEEIIEIIGSQDKIVNQKNNQNNRLNKDNKNID